MRTSLILSIILFCFTALSVRAQHHHPPHPHGGPDEHHKEKIEAMKVGFLTKKLDLTSSEAQEFWPVYNAYEKEREKLRKSFHDEFKVPEEKLESMSDQEVENMIDNVISFRQQQLNLDKKYHQKFKEILPIRKVAKLYKAREDFKRFLLKKLREEHHKE